MALKTVVKTLSTTREQIATGNRSKVNDACTVLVSAPSADIYIGGDDVTTANGILVASGGGLSIDLGPGDNLYAIAGSGTPTVRVLTTRTGWVSGS